MLNPRQFQPAEFTRTSVNLGPRRQDEQTQQRFPFEIYFTTRDGDPALVAHGGTVSHQNGATTFAEIVKTSPANGEWYLVAGATLNGSTGQVTATSVQWLDAFPMSTATQTYLLIAEAAIDEGTARQIAQYAYGPLRVFVHGGITNKWSASIY